MAENAHEALTKMAAKHFDLALVDIKMPGTDGVELQRRMHEVDPEMLVIIMTGYASVETAVSALKNGAYDYVSKPFDPDDIAHTVHNALIPQAGRAGKRAACVKRSPRLFVPRRSSGRVQPWCAFLKPSRRLVRPKPPC